MPFEKGKSGHPEGKPKGAKNKITKDLRKAITGFLQDNFDQVQAEFNSLKSEPKIKLYIDLLPYALPKMSSVEITNFLTDQDVDPIANKLLNS